jgi:oligosaccharide repeat unit polymerase
MSLERIVAAVVGTVLLVASALAVRHARRRLGTPIDVLPVYLAVWGAVFVLFSLPLIDYSRTAVGAWLVIYGSVAATVTGCVIAWRRHGPVVLEPDAARRSVGATLDARRLRLLWVACAVLGLVGFAAFVHAVDGVIGWQSVFDNPGAVRNVKSYSVEFQNAYGLWKLLTYFNQVAFVLWTIGMRVGAFTGRWRWPSLLGFASLIPFVFTADRNLLALLLAWTFLLHLLWPRRGSWRRLAIGLCIAVACAGAGLAAIGNRYGGSLKNHPEIAAYVTTSGLDSLVIPYLYLTADLPTFGQLTEDALAPHTVGQMSVLPLVKVAARLRLLDTPPVQTGVFYPIPFESFSNYSWLGTFWLDFRAPGVILLCALVGFLATTARLRLARQTGFLSLWLASILLYVVAYSPISNALTTSLTWQYLVLGPVLALVLNPAAGRRAVSRIVVRPRFVVPTVIASILVVVVAAFRTPPVRGVDAMRELRDAVEKARYVYGREGHYPNPLALASRLGVNQPAVSFRPQRDYGDPVPETGVIGVVTTDTDVYFRVRTRDGRVYEVHRTEEHGGATVGPERRIG